MFQICKLSEAKSRRREHQVMRYGSYKQIIPNNPEYSIPQLRKLLKQVEKKIGKNISVQEWHEL